MEISTASEKQRWWNELQDYVSQASDDDLKKGVVTELVGSMATDAGGVATEIFKVAVQDFITSSIAFEGDAVKFLQNPVNFWGFNTKERAKVEPLGRILYHFFIARPILAWPANLDPLVLLLSG